MGSRDRHDKRYASLLVRNLKYETSPEQLRSAFSKFGEIRDVYLPLDYYTRKPRGFGFVEFYSHSDADEAMREMFGYELDGNKIEVFVAKHGRSDPYQMRSRERRRRRSRDRSYSRDRRRRSVSYDRRRRRSISRSRDRNMRVSRSVDRGSPRVSGGGLRAEDEAKAEAGVSAEDEAKAEAGVSAEDEATAEDETKAEVGASAEDEVTAEYETKAEDVTTTARNGPRGPGSTPGAHRVADKRGKRTLQRYLMRFKHTLAEEPSSARLSHGPPRTRGQRVWCELPTNLRPIK
ncbi:Ser/Arg-rich splicing factor, putative [Babesia caballi]|uniref:Ser/Arg-rich splicing factor, putative n=1 Tax=Babesia caballi TaxID=5871 RepID=A0AAV4LS53_BABCB|nr:Ser/Arg-rich splicing factor, putative [Babesia caballi]